MSEGSKNKRWLEKCVKGCECEGLFTQEHYDKLADLVGKLNYEWRESSENYNTTNAEDYGYAMTLQLLKEQLITMFEADHHTFYRNRFEARARVTEAKLKRDETTV